MVHIHYVFITPCLTPPTLLRRWVYFLQMYLEIGKTKSPLSKKKCKVKFWLLGENKGTWTGMVRISFKWERCESRLMTQEEISDVGLRCEIRTYGMVWSSGSKEGISVQDFRVESPSELNFQSNQTNRSGCLSNIDGIERDVSGGILSVDNDIKTSLQLNKYTNKSCNE